MRRLPFFLALVPSCLLAQAVTELSPLDYRPPRQQAARVRKASRQPLSFEQRIPGPSPFRMGTLRQSEVDAVVLDSKLPLRGVERSIDRRSRQQGEWVTLDDGRRAWRLAIQSDGASGIRLQFSDFKVGTGEVWLYSEDHKQIFGPYTSESPDVNGVFWSNTVFADIVVVEYLPDRQRSDTPFSISKVLHIMPTQQAVAAGTCQLDVTCYTDWSAVASGVGMYFFQKGGGSYACTGSLVNNTNKDAKPYFLSANHCVADDATARTVNVFWNYQTPACNGKPPELSGLPQTLGATYLASASMGGGDFSLMELAPLPDIDLVFYGWNGTAGALQVGDKTIGVHHPAADFKRVSFGVRDPDMTAQVGSELAPSGMYYQVRELAGRIEGGSSGSPLFTQGGVVVGTLTYGPPGDACSISPFSAGYGRFSAALPSLSAYLDPAAGSGGGGGSGSTPPPATVSATPSSLRTSWAIGSAAPVLSVQIATTSAGSGSVTAKTTQPWMSVSAETLTVTQAKPVALSVSLNLPMLTEAGSYVGSVSLTGTGINQSIGVQVDVTAATGAAKGGPVTIIPLVLDGGGSSTIFTLVNAYGTATLASIAFSSGNGNALTIPLGTQLTSWQNLTIPPFGTATILTAGNSTPQKSGMAAIQSNDPVKRIRAWSQINADALDSAEPVALPFVVPFDATTAASTTLYLFNSADTASATLSLSIYDTGGTLLGSGMITIPAQQEGSVAMTKTAAVFGGKKGILYVTGTGTLSAMGIRTAADGRLSSVPAMPFGLQ